MEDHAGILLRRSSGRLVERVTVCVAPKQKSLYDRLMELGGDAPEYIRQFVDKEFPKLIAKLEVEQDSSAKASA